MDLHGPTTTIDSLPDNVFIEIFSLCRMDEVGHHYAAKSRHCSWKWHRLAHVCRTWRHIMFASSRHLRLELLCTHGTPVENLGHLPALPISISFLSYYKKFDRDNLFAALEHRDRVQAIEVNATCSQLEELATAMQEPFPALTHLRLDSVFVTMPPLPDTFLGGSAPRLQTIYMSRIPFPAAPILFSSAHDLVDIDLSEIPPTGFIPPEAMVASLAAMPRLKKLTFEFERGMSYPDRMRLLPITRTVLPALNVFFFEGLFEYFEDFVAQIDAPQLDCLRVEYLVQQEGTDFQIPQLCKFIDRSDKLLSQFNSADLYIEPYTIAIALDHHRRSLYLSIQQDAIGQVVNQISVMHSNVDRLFIGSGFDHVGDNIRWLELVHLFPSVKVLSVDSGLSWHIPLALKNIAEDRTAEVLPALELLHLENQSVKTVQNFIAARQNIGHPITFINDNRVFQERLNALDVGE